MKIICWLDNRQQSQFLTSINMRACAHVKEHSDYYLYPIFAELFLNSNAIDSKTHATVKGFYLKPKGYSFVQSFYQGGS